MQALINTTKISTTNYISGRTGKYRFIVKCRAGFLTVTEAGEWNNDYYTKHPEGLLTEYKKGSLHTIEFLPEGSDHWLTIFAKKGNKIVLMDEAIMQELTVGMVNGLWYNTNLHSQQQYAAVNSKTWASKVFVYNEPLAQTTVDQSAGNVMA